MFNISKRPRVRFIGRHLMMKGVYLEKLLKGVKRATIRRGIVRPRYKEVIIHAGGRPVAKAKILRVYHGKLRELGEYEAKLEGYESAKELIDDLKRIYRGARDDDIFTVIEFKIVERFDNLPSWDPYLGLKPSDVARIALRYLDGELTDLDRIVLRDLTQTNSIKRTSINLFNDANKRDLVRKVVRKALKLLIERGILSERGKASVD